MTHIASSAFVHPLADIEPGATIGAGARVWANSHVRRDAVVGEDCVVGEGALIDVGVELGPRTKVQAHALLYRGSSTASDVFIGPAACLTNDRFPRASTPDGVQLSEEDWTVLPIHVGRGASIGAHAVVVAGSNIGEWALVAAGAVATRDVLPFQIVAGVPARARGWVCMCGHPLDKANRCRVCSRTYKVRGEGIGADYG